MDGVRYHPSCFPSRSSHSASLPSSTMAVQIPDGIYRLYDLGSGPVDIQHVLDKELATAHAIRRPIRVEPPTIIAQQKVWVYQCMPPLSTSLLAKSKSYSGWLGKLGRAFTLSPRFLLPTPIIRDLPSSHLKTMRSSFWTFP